MQRNTLETLIGAIVLATAIGFVTLVYEAADIQGDGSFEIIAEFGSTGGLSVGDDVRISGIKVGRIIEHSLDPVTYNARIAMSIAPDVQIPADTSARITAASLLGGNYLELLPGADSEMLASGAVIYDTRDPVSISDLLGKMVFSSGNNAAAQ